METKYRFLEYRFTGDREFRSQELGVGSQEVFVDIHIKMRFMIYLVQGFGVQEPAVPDLSINESHPKNERGTK